jgi:hypothetical protein
LSINTIKRVEMEVQKRRLEAVRVALQKKKGEMAQLLGISNSYYSHIGGKNNLRIEHLRSLAESYNVNPLYILDGQEPMFLTDSQNFTVSEPQSVYGKSDHIFCPVEANAGGTYDVSKGEKGKEVFIPGVSGHVVVFKVAGESMLPVVYPGDMLVCRKIDDPGLIKWGHIHVLVDSEWILYVKRLYPGHHENDTISLVSDNPGYGPRHVRKDEIKAIYYPVMRITEVLHGHSGSDIVARIDKIERFLDQIYPDSGFPQTI